MTDLPPDEDIEREPATPDLPPAEAEGIGLEVPEGDALEQAIEVPDDDDYEG